MAKTIRNSDRSTLQLLKMLALAYPKRSLLVLVLLLLAGLTEGLGIAMLFPLLNIAVGGEGATDNFLSRNVEQIFAWSGIEPSIEILLSIFVLIMICKAGIVLLAAKQEGYAAAHVATDLRLSLIRSLMKARWEHFISQPIGRFANALTSEADRASGGYLKACQMIAGVIQVAVYLTLAAFVAWEVVLAGLGVGIVIVGILNGFVVLSRRAGGWQTDLLKSVASRLVDGLQGIKSLKAMGCEDRLEPFLESETMDLNQAQQKQAFAKAGLGAFQEPILFLAVAIGLYVALVWWNSELSTLGVLLFLFWRTVGRIGTVQKYYQTIARSESAYWSIKRAIEHAEIAREISDGIKAPEFNRGIKFNDVSFSYGVKTVLKKTHLTIPANKFTAVIGPSGAGKTTIADLMIGLLRPQSGDVEIDGIRMSEVNLKRWRSMIGYVPQETILFHDTIYTNVTLGDPDMDPEKVEGALRRAGMWDFVSSLPQGLEAVVGERGSKLSGGQRQRIAIARALVRNPKLLILDEATTALDPKTESELCSTLMGLIDQITIFAISHQPAIMEAADLVYQFDGKALSRMN
ncbi:MAG: ABC transporter ATP-binding protein [Deltaproteobacteria bacterium]|nr:ABC transporter ATP-binding protein [Deltaproteobacteria bacterium]